MKYSLLPPFAICLLAAACDTPPPAPGQAIAPAPPMPTSAAPIAAPATQEPPSAPEAKQYVWEPMISAAGGACKVGKATALGGKEGRLQSLEIGFGPKGGLVAWPMDKERAQVIPLNPDGTVTEVGSVVEITSANSIVEILGLGERFMLTTHAVCPDKKFFFKCLHHRLIDSKGKPASDESTTVTREWIGRELSDRNWRGEVMRLWSFMYIPPKVYSFSEVGGALTVEDLATLEGLGEVVEAEAFAADGGSWYAILRDEAGDGDHIFLSKAGARTKLGWLPRSHRAIAIKRAQTGFGVLYGAADSPSKGGRFVSISLDGQKMSEPAELGPGPLPDPFSEDMSFGLSLKKKELWLERRDAAGREIGDPVKVGIGLRGDRDDAPYDVAWTGDRFVVTYGTVEGGQWRLYAVPVTCSSLAR